MLHILFFAYSQANNYFWLLQALGRSKEEYVLEAQSKTKNAQKAALAAAFNYFRSQLETDQSTWDALQMRLADRNWNWWPVDFHCFKNLLSL